MAAYGYSLATLAESNDPLYGHPFYTTLAFLGKGAFGRVVKVLDQRDGQVYAVKCMKGCNMTKYVEYELVNHSLLRHPHIIEFTDVFVWEQYICVVMEFASGGTLLRYVQAHERVKESIARWFFQQLIVGVEYCHERGIANRDLKLDNILLQVFHDLPLPVVKICDFGLSKSDVKSKARSKVGTLAYMAPEVLLSRDSSQYDGKIADIWSCGVMLYAMLYGKYPFGSAPSSGYDVRDIVRMIDKMINQSYPRPEDVKVSSSCLDLLSRMFTPIPGHRITLKEIRQHSWFLHNLPDEAVSMNARALAVTSNITFDQQTHYIRQVIGLLQNAPYQLNLALPKPINDAALDNAILEEVVQQRVSINLLQYMGQLEQRRV